MITHSYAYLFVHSGSSEWSHTTCRLEAGRKSLAYIPFLTMCLVIWDLYLHRAVYTPYSRQCSSFNNFWITSFVIKHIVEYVSSNCGYWAGLGWTNFGCMCSWANCVLWVNFWGDFPLLTSLHLCIICSAYDFLKNHTTKKDIPRRERHTEPSLPIKIRNQLLYGIHQLSPPLLGVHKRKPKW